MAAALPDKKNPWLLILIFLVFSLSLMWAGFASYQHQKQRVERETIASLETVTNLKAQELAWWRRERLGDARIMTTNPLLAWELLELIKFPRSHSARQSLLDWLRTFQETYRYQSMQLLDARGELLLQTGRTSESNCLFCKNLIQELIQHPRIIFSDFYWDTESRSFRCLILAPVFFEGQNSLQGIVVLQINPSNFIFPLLQTWPTTSSSAETVLALREGEEVVLLNRLSQQPEAAAPSIHIPLTKDDFPAVQGIKGREGFVRGKDYRQVPVLAVVRSVPDSPWYLVAKVDEKEVFAESEKFALHTGSLVGAMILAGGLGLAAIWRQNYLHFLGQLANLEAAQTKKLDDILSATPDQFFLVDDAGRYLYANKAATQALSLNSEEPLGKKIQEVGFPAKTGNHLAAQTAEVFHAGQPLTGEVSFPNQGALKFFDYILTPLRDPQGSIISVLTTLRDITDRKHLEQRLQEELHFKETLLEAIPSPIFFKDVQGHYLGCNRAFETYIGLPRRDFVGKSVFDLVPGELAAIYHAKDAELLEQRDVQMYESQVKAADGQTSEVIFYKAPFTHLDGTLAGLIGIIMDITKRKQAEEQVKASLREKEVLLKEIHHRVKNNMQIISSLLRLQSSRVKNQEVQAVFQESQNRIRSMALVHEMLYRSPDLARIHFSSYLEVLVKSLYRSFRTQPKQITLNLDRGDFFLPADQALSCGLIITELVTNALKYAFPAGQHGELSLIARQTPHQEIELVVQDNGVGLPPDLDYRHTESLGLRLVMLLVGQLQGSVEVDRTNGTSFIITFKVQDHD